MCAAGFYADGDSRLCNEACTLNNSEVAICSVQRDRPTTQLAAAAFDRQSTGLEDRHKTGSTSGGRGLAPTTTADRHRLLLLAVAVTFLLTRRCYTVIFFLSVVVSRLAQVHCLPASFVNR